jgi:hypothetical protein
MMVNEVTVMVNEGAERNAKVVGSMHTRLVVTDFIGFAASVWQQGWGKVQAFAWREVLQWYGTVCGVYGGQVWCVGRQGQRCTTARAVEVELPYATALCSTCISR